MNFFKNMLLLFIITCSATIHCMKLDLSKIKPAERYNVVAQLLHKTKQTKNLELVYFKENHGHAVDNIKKLRRLKYHGYSALGFACVAIEVYSLPNPNKKNFDLASYNTRKEFIQELLWHGFKPTKKDRKLALQVENEEQILPSYKTKVGGFFYQKSDLFNIE